MADLVFDQKERVRQATDIVELIGSYVQLRREGRGYKALCPWHDDTRPSLQINPERQSFKCWVCDLGGDVFSFLMKMENVEFREALEMLAERAGIRLEREGRPHEPGSPDDKRVLFAAMAWGVEQYHRYLLEAPQAELARKYLRERGLTAESIRTFKLGYAPDEWEWIDARGRVASFSTAVLERVDLVRRRPNGPGVYDPFKGRVLFPILDAQGRAVALGGRVLPELAKPDTAKYINSRETPLFTKSKMLYGLSAARDAIRKSGEALVMEGYTDVIVAHQFGFTEAVAVLGTALGGEHIQLLRRMADDLRIVCVLDGDEAGRRRANEVLELFVAANADLRILTLPDELDPCEFLLERGAEAFSIALEASRDALRHAFDVATTGIDLAGDLHAASRALEQLLSTIAKAPRLRSDVTMDDRLREERFLLRLSKDFAVPEEQVRERLTQLRRKSGGAVARRAEPASNTSDGVQAWPSLTPHERDLIEILLVFPASFARLTPVVRGEQLAHPLARAVWAKAGQLDARGVELNFHRLLLEFDDPRIKTMLVELDERARARGPGELESWLADVTSGFGKRAHEESRRRHEAAIKQGQLSPQEVIARLLKIQEQERARQGISAPTDG